MAFITEDFLLQSATARRLYHDYAADRPILDYHCHLPPGDLLQNRRFGNLFEIWLEGDHYKWRAMRANGVPERYCTGDADPYEKFLAWARTVPYTLRNPLYHWTHLELKRYFDIDELLDEKSAPRIWAQANERLADDAMTVHGILGRSRVATLCTTDDPADSLDVHERLQSGSQAIRIYPAFRPDGALKTEDPQAFNLWVDRLAGSVNIEIARLSDLLDALRARHDDFHRLGCRLSDHGLNFCYAEPCTESEAQAIFLKVRGQAAPTQAESAQFASYLMLFFGHLDAEKNWTKQLHVGAYRSASTRGLQSIGRDSGFDSIADWPQVAPLNRYLDLLDRDNRLPKTIVYNLNPADNYAFATLIGNFQDGSLAGKLQLGSGWWFLDQKQGIEWQLDALSYCGLLSRFVGMTTDSRSFMSFPRHEYFRRILCNLLGNEMEAGLIPNDERLVGEMVGNICFDNAARYFDFPSTQGDAPVPALASAREQH